MPISHYLPQLKFTDAPANNIVPDAPTLCTVNEIKLNDPLIVGKFGVPPDGNLKCGKTAVAIPTFSILIV